MLRRAEVHASTRILLVMAAALAIVAGWWVLLAINSAIVGVVYSILWTLAVLIVARLLTAVGVGYNRLTARPAGGGETATALAELTDLHERGLITAEEYDAKRSKIVERL
jgi:membrane protein implicated in regulation of membrane protease activity